MQKSKFSLRKFVCPWCCQHIYWLMNCNIRADHDLIALRSNVNIIYSHPLLLDDRSGKRYDSDLGHSFGTFFDISRCFWFLILHPSTVTAFIIIDNFCRFVFLVFVTLSIKVHFRCFWGKYWVGVARSELSGCEWVHLLHQMY